MNEDVAVGVTELLNRASGGNREALDRLMPLVYREMRRLAGSYLLKERPGHTLQATAVANEAYLRVDAEELHEALERLAALDPRQSQIVAHRFYGGLTAEETAEVMGISTGTVKREWRTARAWLCHELTPRGERDGAK